jgi:glycosyltransferase involved in cell wall biosynthesis
MGKTRRFIACSDAVRENLVREQGVAGTGIETVHESIPVDGVRPERCREQILHELNLPAEAQVVIGVGTVGWRKGTDIFIQLARAVCQQCNRARFVWVGGGPSAEFEYDVRTSGLRENMRFVGARRVSADYLAASDVFALVSREDPYPLVCLEAAALGKPIVCFAGAGGAPEFVEQDCGFVVPYLDITAMAERVASLLDSAESRRTAGEAARCKVAERHDISLAAPRILKIIERTIAEN